MAVLDQRLDQRVDVMVERGLVRELDELYEKVGLLSTWSQIFLNGELEM